MAGFPLCRGDLLSLSVGARLGDHEIVGHLGSGGMGDVYRARDTRLGREVALKVVREHHAGDPAQVARLRREARLLAALSHPNIAAIHGVIEEGDVLCLVLELVEGPSLSERLARGPLEQQEALKLGAALAAGLEAAHDAGVIHRDIKPANLKLRPDGRLTILDFGVGKTTAALTGDAASPTLDATRPAGALGTPGYMSPEQARGQDSDRRADAWAFGCVLFECLAGSPAFPGDSPSDRLSASLMSEPDWSALPESTPPGILRILEGCLAKDPALRLRDMRDARLELEACISPSTGTGRRAFVPPAHTERRRAIARMALALMLVAAAAALGAWTLRGRTASASAPAPPARVELALPPLSGIAIEPNALALAPGGESAAAMTSHWGSLTGAPCLAIRRLDAPAWSCLTDLFVVSDAAFSPDGLTLAIAGERHLWLVSASGGAPRKLAPTVAPTGMTWGRGNDIFFAPGRADGIWRIPATGGSAVKVTEPRVDAGEMSHRWPRLSLDGRYLTYTVKTASIETFSDAKIRAVDLSTGEDREILSGGTSGMITPSRHLIFARAGFLHGVPLDDTLRPTGPSVEIAPVRMDAVSGAAGHALAANGTLALLDGTSARDSQLSIVSLDGTSRDIGPRGRWLNPDVSDDGRRIVMSGMAANDQLWVMDLADGRTRAITRGGGNRHLPRWLPGKPQVIYYLEAPGRSGLYVTGSDGSGEETPLILDEAQDLSFPAFSVAPDGRSVFIPRRTASGEFDIFRVPLDGSPSARVVDRSGMEGEPLVSPDGRWLVFTSDAALFLLALDRTGAAPVLISQGLGAEILKGGWGRGGREFYFTTGQSFAVVEVPEDTSVDHVPAPRALPLPARTDWSALPDGSGFVVRKDDEPDPPSPWLHLWTGFLDDLERLAPHP